MRPLAPLLLLCAACGGPTFTETDRSLDATGRPELAQVAPEASTPEVADPPDAEAEVRRLGVAEQQGAPDATANEGPLDSSADASPHPEASPAPDADAAIDAGAADSAEDAPNPNASIFCNGRSCAGCASNRFVVACSGMICACCADDAGLQGCTYN